MKKYCISFITAMLLIAAFDCQAQNKTATTNIPQPKTIAEISRLQPQDTYSLPWAPIKESNILWKKRVWREIDVNKDGNGALSYNAETPAENTLARILVQGFLDGKYKAYDPNDGRFINELTAQDFMAQLTHGSRGTAADLDVSKISSYRIKEDWLYLKDEGKVVVRILGIAPVMQNVSKDGSVTNRPICLLYYPDVREYLAAQKIHSGKSIHDMSWDELFEGRKFSSAITKVVNEDVALSR